MVGHRAQLPVQLEKGPDPGTRPARQGTVHGPCPVDDGHGRRSDVEQGLDLGTCGGIRLHRKDALHRLGTHRAPRRRDRAPERDGVGRVDRQDQIRERILHFLALEEADGPDQPIGDAQPPEGGLERLRLEIHPVQDRGLQIGVPVHQLAAQPDLRLLIRQLVQLRCRPAPVLRPQSLAQAVPIAGHHAVRDLQYLRGGPVVLLQADDLGPREVVRERQERLHVGAPEPVDRLVIVTDGTDVGIATRQQAQELELSPVRVLILVHEQRAEAPGDLVPGLVRQQVDRAQYQVAEVQPVAALQMLLIRGIELVQREVHRRAEPVQVVARAQSVILGARDQIGGRLELVRGPSTAGRVAQDREGVGAVQYRKTRIDAGPGSVASQQPVAERMKGADVRVGRRRQHRGRAIAHLLGGLVGEGHRQHRPRRDAAPLGQIGDLGGDRPRLSRSGTCQDEQRAAPVLHGAPLRLVQDLQVVFDQMVFDQRRPAPGPGTRQCAAGQLRRPRPGSTPAPDPWPSRAAG